MIVPMTSTCPCASAGSAPVERPMVTNSTSMPSAAKNPRSAARKNGADVKYGGAASLTCSGALGAVRRLAGAVDGVAA